MIDSKRIALIGAHTKDSLSYGLGNGMPWPRGALKKDMLERFKPITLGAPEGKKNLLIAGSSTFVAMGGKPLPGRYMIGVSRKVEEPVTLPSGAVLVPSFGEALRYAETLNDLHEVFFIGGKSSWEEGLRHASRALITVVHKEVECEGLIKLDQSLEAMAKASGFVMISQEHTVDEWSGPVRVDFLEYFKDRS